MGIKLIRREWKSGSVECCHKYICDTEADFDNLPVSPAGSTAVSLWSKKERVVNTKGRWVPYGENFVGAPILDLIKGIGTGEVTETVTADSDFSLDWSTLLGLPIKLYPIYCDIGDVDISTVAYGAKVHIDKHYKIVVTRNGVVKELYLDDGGSNEYGESTYVAKETLPLIGISDEDQTEATCCYIIPNNMREIYEKVAGYTLSDEMLEAFKLALPPNSILIPDRWTGGIDATTHSVAVTYGAETEVTALGVTDTNDEGIVKAYEVYADEALVDTVPKAETIDATALGVTAGASVTVKAKSIIDTTSEASNAVIF